MHRTLHITTARCSMILTAALGLSLVAGGCNNKPAPEGTPDTAKPMGPSSPDLKNKDQSKNAAGSSSPSTAVPATPPTATPMSPQSPDLQQKDVSKSPATPAITSEMPVKTPDFKDATHTLTGESPYFATRPTGDAKPAGTLSKGTPVLVVIPGDTYSMVKLGDGKEAYVPTAELQPK